MDARLQDLPFDPAALNRLSPGLITSHRQAAGRPLVNKP